MPRDDASLLSTSISPPVLRYSRRSHRQSASETLPMVRVGGAFPRSAASVAYEPSLRWSDAIDRKRTIGLVQMRWKISSPRTLTGRPFGPAYVAIHLVATVVGLTKRPDATMVTGQSDCAM